jgi:hypothetical protein
MPFDIDTKINPYKDFDIISKIADIERVDD